MNKQKILNILDTMSFDELNDLQKIIENKKEEFSNSSKYSFKILFMNYTKLINLIHNSTVTTDVCLKNILINFDFNNETFELNPRIYLSDEDCTKVIENNKIAANKEEELIKKILSFENEVNKFATDHNLTFEIVIENLHNKLINEI